MESKNQHTTSVVRLGEFSTAFVLLFALWGCMRNTPQPYTVTFNPNRGSAIEAQQVKNGAKATAFDFNTAITANTTLYAKWILTLQGFVNQNLILTLQA